jgi:hypothetical protein
MISQVLMTFNIFWFVEDTTGLRTVKKPVIHGRSHNYRIGFKTQHVVVDSENERRRIEMIISAFHFTIQ